jgi:hypothetical protein
MTDYDEGDLELRYNLGGIFGWIIADIHWLSERSPSTHESNPQQLNNRKSRRKTKVNFKIMQNAIWKRKFHEDFKRR